jgi:hypothetical protein
VRSTAGEVKVVVFVRRGRKLGCTTETRVRGFDQRILIRVTATGHGSSPTFTLNLTDPRIICGYFFKFWLLFTSVPRRERAFINRDSIKIANPMQSNDGIN